MGSITCGDCGTDLDRRSAVTREVHVDHEDGLGYDRVPMPLCPNCDLKRHGHDCTHCGRTHRSIEAAADCCVGTSKAPDCRECGRRMERGAWGYDAAGNQTIEWAECEGCGIGWGAFTGWHDLDQQPADGGEA